jgi:hypothetical protein
MQSWYDAQGRGGRGQTAGWRGARPAVVQRERRTDTCRGGETSRRFVAWGVLGKAHGIGWRAASGGAARAVARSARRRVPVSEPFQLRALRARFSPKF